MWTVLDRGVSGKGLVFTARRDVSGERGPLSHDEEPRISGLELTIAYRHESEHYTGGNYGGDGRDFSNQPYVGDDVVLDVALEQQLGDVYLQQRAVGMWFLPDRSSYSGGVAIDIHARWTGWPWVHPFASGYAEYLVGDDIVDRIFPDGYRARLLLGIAQPSRLGDLMIFGFGDVGHRYGLQALSEEATLGFGVRLALGRSWSVPTGGASPAAPLPSAVRSLP